MKQLKLVENGESIVVTALSGYNPLQHLNDITTKLKVIHFKGVVVFDLLCVNGESNNRFVTLMFDGLKFNRKSFTVIAEIDSKLKQDQDDFFRSHPDFLKESVLSSADLALF